MLPGFPLCSGPHPPQQFRRKKPNVVEGWGDGKTEAIHHRRRQTWPLVSQEDLGSLELKSKQFRHLCICNGIKL